jgi:hypothetical protein
LGGKILENRQEASNLAEQMRHVEAVINMLDPSYSLRAISVKRRATGKWFKRGTLYRKALDVMRTAEKPLTATELAWEVLRRPRSKRTIKKPSRYSGPAFWPACGIMPGRACNRLMMEARQSGN